MEEQTQNLTAIDEKSARKFRAAVLGVFLVAMAYILGLAAYAHFSRDRNREILNPYISMPNAKILSAGVMANSELEQPTVVASFEMPHDQSREQVRQWLQSHNDLSLWTPVDGLTAAKSDASPFATWHSTMGNRDYELTFAGGGLVQLKITNHRMPALPISAKSFAAKPKSLHPGKHPAIGPVKKAP